MPSLRRNLGFPNLWHTSWKPPERELPWIPYIKWPALSASAQRRFLEQKLCDKNARAEDSVTKPCTPCRSTRHFQALLSNLAEPAIGLRHAGNNG